MKDYPDNLPPLQPWNEEKHAMMNRIKQLEWKIEYLQRAGDNLAKKIKKDYPDNWVIHVVDIWNSAKEN